MDTRTQVKQYVDIAWRRKWWVLVPTVVGAVVSLYLYWSIPKIYRATTTILVTRQSVPDDIVRSTVTMRLDERMKSLKIQVLSRRYLEKVAREIGLFEEGADEAQIEEACHQVASSVNLEWDKRDLSWFKIQVVDREPKRAARVANRLAEMFIQQNTELREAQAKVSVETVETWLEQTRAVLEARDKEIADYRTLNLYELPEQEGSAIQLMTASANRVAQLSSDIQLRSDRLSILRSEERAGRAAAAALGISTGGGDPNAQKLLQLERELHDLLVNYTDENPLVRRKRDQIAQFKAAYPSAAKAGSDDEASPEVRRLQSEIRNLESDRAREQRKVDELRARIANMPIRQQELQKMTRGYDQLKATYDKTQSKLEEAQRSLDVESAKKGEQFVIQDRARPPAVPFQPQFLIMFLMGLGAGLGLGIGIAALLEFLDQSVRGEEQFADLFPDLPILGSIPNLVQPGPDKPRFPVIGKKRAAAGALALAAMLGGLFA